MEESVAYVGHTCPTCGGPSHPATGCAYTPTFIVCGPCTRRAWAWIVETTNSKGRRKGRPSFYDHVNRVSDSVFTASDCSARCT